MFRIVLRIWDALPNDANGHPMGQSLQPPQEFDEIKSLLKILELILKTFEVVTFRVFER